MPKLRGMKPLKLTASAIVVLNKMKLCCVLETVNVHN